MTSEQEQWPAVVPYVEWHTGPRRTATFVMPSFGATTPPVVSVDGRQYLTYWGQVTFEIPADRAVHLSVHLEAEAIRGAASILVPPGDAVWLQYTVQKLGGRGSLALVAPPV